MSPDAEAILGQALALHPGDKGKYPIDRMDPEEVQTLDRRLRARGFSVYTSSGMIAVQRNMKPSGRRGRVAAKAKRRLSPSEALQQAGLIAQTLADKARGLQREVDHGAPSPHLVAGEKDSMVQMVEHIREALQWL